MSSLAPESQSVRFERDNSQRRRRPSEHCEANPDSRSKECRQLVIAFDGTGNRFSGTDADSNILKIFRMLDRNDEAQHHYYQPGIGTYVTTTSLSHTSRIARLKSWYMKSKDSAVGSSFAEHVMGGYKFLMRYHTPGDEIYLFGFSRGAYTARFLAEMLDHIGLLSAGNEEMARFAWKTFQKWQVRQERTAEEKAQKKQLLEFMCAFRETFSRPVRRIRFLGLFDTVNSVPRFENAWMQRSKFPYTARSTAKVIRHAVAIDERRAKFRQDLVSEAKHTKHKKDDGHHWHLYHHYRREDGSTKRAREGSERGASVERGRLSAESKRYQPTKRKSMHQDGLRDSLVPPENFRDASEISGVRSLSPGLSAGRPSDNDGASSITSRSHSSLAAIQHAFDSDSDDEGEQDIQEVWFAGCHADIGGGWPLDEGDDSALSHIPLVWMVHEAQRAGLRFDETKVRALNCCPDEEPPAGPRRSTFATIPQIEVDGATPPTEREPASPNDDATPANGSNKTDSELSRFHRSLQYAATRGRMHDVLQFNNGVSAGSVISWNIMEYLPFRRMDLQPDGSWKSVSWPLPRGEVRDMPDHVVVHHSVLKRMEENEDYRPGNLICGGGGRGVRRAPKELGMGRWKVLREEGDPVGEVYVRAEAPLRRKDTEVAHL